MAKGEALHTVVGMWISEVPEGNSVETQNKNPGLKSSWDSAVPLLGYITKGNKIIISKLYLPTNFTTTLFTIVNYCQVTKSAGALVDQWITKMWHICTLKFFSLFGLFWGRVSLYGSGWPWTHFVAQAGLELAVSLLNAGITVMCPTPGLHTGILFSHQRMKSYHLQQMTEIGGYYVKWN